MQRKKIIIAAAAFVLVILAIILSVRACSDRKAGSDAPAAAQVSTAVPDRAQAQATTRPAEATVAENKPAAAAQPEKIGDSFVFPAEGVRPFAVMIDNEGTRSLPQGGLDKAQVIYEIIVEGGESRLMPVFWGTSPELIGPVRSSRHYFLDYAMENDAIYVHFGWSPMAMRDISAFKINNINGVANGGEIFWDLTKDRYNWQDSYTSTKNILDYVSKARYRTTTDRKPVFSYNKEDAAPDNGSRAESISLRYSASYSCGFIYDAQSGLYKRTRKNQPQMERVSGKQLEAKNIVIQLVQNYTIKGDDAGRQEVRTVGSGNGWYVTDGKAVKIKWSKESRQAATRYAGEDGRPISLNPGQTWVQIVPVDGKVEIK